jgi:AcrR family transcriptional regulator
MARPKASVIPRGESREKLIEAAETLFSEAGFDGVSIRAIAEAAGVNIALIGYYFGGKEGLFTEAFRRSAEPINAGRLALLKEIPLRDGRPDLRDLIRAWLVPVFRSDAERTQHHLFIRLSTILADRSTELFEKLESEIHHSVNGLFLDALQKCLPQISRDTLRWRLYFTIAATTVATKPDIPGMPGAGPRNGGEGIYRNLQPLIDFAEAGFRAPETVEQPDDRTVADRPRRRKKPVSA